MKGKSFLPKGNWNFRNSGARSMAKFAANFVTVGRNTMPRRKMATMRAALAAVKKDLIAEQTEVLEKRRDDACGELRQSRDARYRELLDDQRDIRHQLRWRQENGLDNTIFLAALGERETGDDRSIPTFADTAAEAVLRPGADRDDRIPSHVAPREDRAGIKSGADIGASIATGLGFGVLFMLDGIADGLTGSTPKAQPKLPEPAMRVDPFAGAFDEARQREAIEREEDYEARRKQRSYGD